jgi:hypothetical protein
MAYAQYSDFLDRAQLLRQKLLKQDYVALKSSQHKFYGRHYQLVDRSEISIHQMAMNLFYFMYIFLPLSATRLLLDMTMTNMMGVV